jgi:hypothetical protein
MADDHGSAQPHTMRNPGTCRYPEADGESTEGVRERVSLEGATRRPV